MYTILDVANHFGIPRIRKGHAPAGTFNVICPFCGDARGKCNMVIAKDGKENVYHCYNCDSSGSMYDLYASLKGLTGSSGMSATKMAAKEMRAVLGKKDAAYSFCMAMPAAMTEKKADETHLDLVYREFLALLSLKDEHRKDLLRRGLTEAQIDHYGFRSTPHSARGYEIARKLQCKGVSLRGVPGFYKDRWGDWTLNFYEKNAGYLCPVYDSKRRVIGFQIRSDSLDGPKYLWLTSTGKADGVSSGSPATFLGDANTDSVVITEGILKATVIHALSGCSVIGIAGVDNMASLPALLKSLSNLTCVYEAMDMDKYMAVQCDKKEKSCDSCPGYHKCPDKEKKKVKIQKATNKLLKICIDYDRILMRWDHHISEGKIVWNGKEKGLDDWLNSKRKVKDAL